MWISQLTRWLDLVAPRRCRVCGRRLSVTENVICLPCIAHLPRTYYWRNPLDNELARRFWGRVPVERVASYFFYYPRTGVGQMIYDLKYHSQPWVGVALGRCMGRELAESGFFEGVDLLVPVPLARKRRRARGYNQSERIARGISEVTDIPVETKCVGRTRFVTSQTHLTVGERRDNVEGLFRLKDGRRVAGKHIMLIDDVITTGATIVACATALCEAEGVKVSVLSLGFAKG